MIPDPARPHRQVPISYIGAAWRRMAILAQRPSRLVSAHRAVGEERAGDKREPYDADAVHGDLSDMPARPVWLDVPLARSVTPHLVIDEPLRSYARHLIDEARQENY